MAAGMQNGIAAYPIHVRSEISVQFCEPQLSGVHRITHFDRNEVVMDVETTSHLGKTAAINFVSLSCEFSLPDNHTLSYLQSNDKNIVF